MKYKDLLLPKIVFETKYKQGYRYLDRCGETMIEIENKLKNWLAKDVSPSSGRMNNAVEKMIFNFSSLKLDLVQYDVKDLDTGIFISDSKKMFDIVCSNLGIKEFIRFGLRYWFLYPLNSIEDGRKILSKSKIFSVNNNIEKLFGKRLKDTSVVIILEEKDKKQSFGHRISLSVVHKEGIDYENEGKDEFLTTPPHKLPRGQREALSAQLERKAREAKEPSIAMLVDIDSYVENPQKEHFDKFINDSIKLTTENVIKIVEG
jgi:hypothetical protein